MDTEWGEKMEKTIFAGKMAGLMIDEVVRDHEFSMNTKHFHDSYELYFLLEGERYYFIDRETYHVKKGMVVLINRQQIHKTSLAGKSYHDRILLQISGEGFGTFFAQAGLIPLDQLFEENYGVTELPEKVWDQIKSQLFAIRSELAEKQGRYEVMVKLKLAEILLLIYRCRRNKVLKRDGGEISTVQTAKHQKVHEVADYLLHHYNTGESLEELAKRFYISKSYLSRIFREVTGFSVNEYRNLTRVKKAQDLLKDSEYSVTEISELLGFESVTYFERVFKKLADRTPLKYRNEKRRVSRPL